MPVIAFRETFDWSMGPLGWSTADICSRSGFGMAPRVTMLDAYAVIAYLRDEPADFAKVTVYRDLAPALDVVICG